MTLPGGPADKLGNRYEKWWTLSELVRMLHGETDEIRIEVPGVEKAEFVVKAGALREFHQVKRQHPDGKWSLHALYRDGLLQTIGEILTDDENRFVFVSGSEAPELSGLCEAAHAADSPEEFEREFLSARRRKEALGKLQSCWKVDFQSLVERLRRVAIRTIDERNLEEKVRWGLEALFLGDPGRIMAELRAIVEDSVQRRIARQTLVELLDVRGHRLRRLRSPKEAGDAVQAATDAYLIAARNRLIRRRLVSMSAAKTLISRLGGTATDSVLTGRAGSGKTACVIEVAETLKK